MTPGVIRHWFTGFSAVQSPTVTDNELVQGDFLNDVLKVDYLRSPLSRIPYCFAEIFVKGPCRSLMVCIAVPNRLAF